MSQAGSSRPDRGLDIVRPRWTAAARPCSQRSCDAGGLDSGSAQQETRGGNRSERARERHQARILGIGFAVKTTCSQSTATVALAGDLDLASELQAHRAIADAVASGRREIILDLRRLEFLDARGLRLVAQLDALARRDGFDLSIVRGTPAVQRPFELVGLAHELAFVDSRVSVDGGAAA